ncbi:MAG: biopolymer transporter ExbD [Candidatus Omnitrophota bacterium]
MKIEPNRSYMFSLESVAMTDIVLNMFIFFFISFSLLYTFNPTKAKHIKVNLPKAKNVSVSQKASSSVTITLSSDGPMYLDGKVVTFKELEAQLDGVSKSVEPVSVIVQIDRLVPFKNVVRVLDVLNGLDITNLRIAAEEDGK